MARFQRTWLLITASMLLIACGPPAPEPEEALRLWVSDMQLAAEDKDRSAMLDKISEAYADARGNNRKDIGDKLLIYFLRQQSVAFISTIDAIKINGETAAEVVLTVAMAGTNDGAFGLSADAYNFELELERVDSEWFLIGAKWGELGKDLR